ncbi:patatin-like phospholipase family protein [Xanthomonas sp. NCPPB 2632]|uniref:patatin-like phospholipase family protein n=1 Tax=Xanthomonas sp. NCPPB 2632 TaxID=3240912 RepID=UPI0035143899
MKEERILSYLAFQGGGAKGVSHIGSLAAVNELNLEIGGVAGTSAGALIAALVSAGYSAKEIFDCDSGDHILKDLCDGNYADPTKLFSERGWKSIKSIIKWKNRLARYFRLWRSEKGYLSFFAKGSAVVAILFMIIFAAIFPLVFLVIVACVSGYLAAFLFRAYKGLCSLSNVRRVFDEAICKKLLVDTSDVTFRQMKGAGALPLKLVATNTTDSKLELFSYETTPDVAVVDAVCASICIPFVFERWSFLCKRKGEDIAVKKVFIDGGLMSNLPSWSFDEERSLNKEAVTIAFGLEGENGSSFWLMSALDAVIAGPPQIHRRGIVDPPLVSANHNPRSPDHFAA